MQALNINTAGFKQFLSIDAQNTQQDSDQSVDALPKASLETESLRDAPKTSVLLSKVELANDELI